MTTPKLRTDLPPLPDRIAKLRLSPKGYPVPWFVQWENGVPDFRIVEHGKFERAHRGKLCWLCGEPLGRYKSFVAGPMCGVNRTSSEPPSHFECAQFAAMACPFLTTPSAKRNERGMENAIAPPGFGIKRNPGVAMVWTTLKYDVFRVPTGYLVEMGPPEHVLWYCEGRTATRDEVEHSIATGLPALEDMAKAESREAEITLEKMVNEFERLIPDAVAA